MPYLLWTLALFSTASGLFVIVFASLNRDTMFGSALLVAGSVAIAGGFVTAGLAVAVAELRLVLQALRARLPAVPRPLKPGERRDTAERKDGEKQPGPPRHRMPPRPAAGTPPSPPSALPGAPLRPLSANREPPAAQPEGGRVSTPHEPAGKARPEWLRRTFGDLSAKRGNASKQRRPPQSADPPPPPKVFDMVWPSARGRPAGEEIPIDEAPTSPAAGRPAAPLAPPAPPRTDARPTILKSGVIDEIPYTLFADGSIEAQMPQGTTRFASIEALRAHLEKREE